MRTRHTQKNNPIQSVAVEAAIRTTGSDVILQRRRRSTLGIVTDDGDIRKQRRTRTITSIDSIPVHWHTNEDEENLEIRKFNSNSILIIILIIVFYFYYYFYYYYYYYL